MNRRNFVDLGIRSASAVVFTSAGWLMGTRALTMPIPSPDPTCTCFARQVGYCRYSGVGGCECAAWVCYDWDKADCTTACDTQCSVTNCGCSNCPR